MKICKRFVVLLLLALPVLVAISGCETIEDELANLMNPEDSDEQPDYVLTIHRIVRYPRGSHQIERKIQSIDGRTVWINKNFFIHSKNIEDMKLVPDAKREGFYDLRLKLDRQGRLIWMQLSVEFKHEPLALVIDGVFYRSFKPVQQTDEDDEWVLLKGPIDGVTAKALEKNAKKNFKFYHRNDPDQPLW